MVASNSETLSNAISGDVSGSFIAGSDAADNINTSSDNATIFTYGGNDTIYNNQTHYAVVDAGNDDDFIYGMTYNSSLNGSSGNDSITGSFSNATLRGGAGDDSINGLGYSTLNVYQFGIGDGNDTILNYRNDDTIQTHNGTYFYTVASGNDVIIRMYDGTLTLKEARGKSINIRSGYNPEGIYNAYYNSAVNGTSNDNFINSYASGSTINGGAGDDTILNGWSASLSIIDGGEGNDLIFNQSGNVTIDAGAGNDTVYGEITSARNRLYRIHSNSGQDVILGYSSTDIIEITDDTFYSTSTIDADTIIKIGNAQMILKDYTGSLNIIGNQAVDTVFSNTNSNTLISGSSYADSIRNRGGSYVTISAANGSDTVDSWGSHVSINGGADNDSIYMYTNAEDHTVNGGAGNDTIRDGGTRDKIFGESGDDYIYLFTNATHTTVDAGIGNDEIYCGAQNASLNGGADNDYIHLYTQSENVTVRGGAGNDTLKNYSNAFVYEFDESSGYDVIDGFNSNSTIMLTGGEYSISIDGNSDTIIEVDNSRITVKNYTDTINIIGTKKQDPNVVNGTSNNDSLRNTSADMTVNGFGGNDTIDNRGGNCVVNGGDGNDSLHNHGAGVSLAGGEGDDTIWNCSGTDDTASNATIDGGAGDDSILNNSANANVIIYGGVGSDYIRSHGANTTILGGEDNDYLDNYGNHSSVLGGVGNDTIYSSSVSSDAFIDAGAGDDSLRYYGTRGTLLGDAGNDSLWNHGEGLYMNGGGDNDYIINWEEGDNATVLGGGGDDIIWNYGDNVSLNAGAGNDTINLRNSNASFVQYDNGDGSLIINGVGSDYTLKIAGAVYSTLKNNSGDLIVGVGSDSITLKNDSLTSFNIDGTLRPDNVGITLANTTANTIINGTDYYDAVSNNANNVQIYVGNGPDSIYNTTGSYITLDGGDGSDTINNRFAEYISINGGDGADSIYGNNNHATILGGNSNDTIIGNHWRSILSGGDGNDIISLTTYWHNTINGGNGDDSVITSGNEHYIDGGAGNDFISLSGDNLTVAGGAGNNTVYGDSSQHHTYQYGGGNDLIVGFGSNDTITISGSSWTRSTVDNDVLVRIADSGTITLKNARNESININNTVEQTVEANIYTPQDVIKNFMLSLDSATTSSAETMLNDAVRFSSKSKYTTIQQVINDMVSDCRTYNTNYTNGWKMFLRDKCGIDLDNGDTGAITGSDAGGSTYEKTASSIVQEVGNIDTDFTGNSFTLNDYGVSFELGRLNNNSDPITFDFNSLTPAQQYIWQGLHSWWAKAALDLVVESYGNNFDFTSPATVNKIYFGFTNTNDGNLGTTWQVWDNDYNKNPIDGTTKTLAMALNIKKFGSLVNGNEDGRRSGSWDFYTDRVLAHEFTHAVMDANISYHFNLPQFIKDGLSELTHGCDDDRKDEISTLARDPNALNNALSLKFNSYDAYAGGFMFMRYLAKQAADNSSSSNFSSVMQSNNYSDTGYLPEGISINDSVLTASNQYEDETIDLADYSSTVKRVNATALTKNITVLGAASNDWIDGGNGADKIFGASGDDSLYGGSDDDTIYGGSGNDWLNGGAGDDSLYGGSDADTMTGGAGNDIFVHGSNSDMITDYRSDEDKIKITGGELIGDSVSGNDIILLTNTGSIIIKDGKDQKITVIDRDGIENTQIYGREALSSLNVGDFDGVTLKSSKLTLGTPFSGAVDLANFSSKVKTIDATKTTDAVELIGNNNKNTFKAGSGGSTLDGAGGNDKLYGGDGVDVFIFDGQGKDKIYNYAAGDRIEFTVGITKSKLSGKNLKVTVEGGGVLTVNKIFGTEMTITTADGKTNNYIFDKKHKDMDAALENANAQMPADDYWFMNDSTVEENALSSIISTDAAIDLATSFETDMFPVKSEEPVDVTCFDSKQNDRPHLLYRTQTS